MKKCCSTVKKTVKRNANALKPLIFLVFPFFDSHSSGPKGRGFESRHFDHKKALKHNGFRAFLFYFVIEKSVEKCLKKPYFEVFGLSNDCQTFCPIIPAQVFASCMRRFSSRVLTKTVPLYPGTGQAMTSYQANRKDDALIESPKRFASGFWTNGLKL